MRALGDPVCCLATDVYVMKLIKLHCFLDLSPMNPIDSLYIHLEPNKREVHISRDAFKRKNFYPRSDNKMPSFDHKGSFYANLCTNREILV